jgi:hypothetical protein
VTPLSPPGATSARRLIVSPGRENSSAFRARTVFRPAALPDTLASRFPDVSVFRLFAFATAKFSPHRGASFGRGLLGPRPSAPPHPSSQPDIRLDPECDASPIRSNSLASDTSGHGFLIAFVADDPRQLPNTLRSGTPSRHRYDPGRADRIGRSASNNSVSLPDRVPPVVAGEQPLEVFDLARFVVPKTLEK